ncbi:MAG TPA: hypothetical protein VMD92_14430 [Acidobacteriaceae bacterium]|nr:hypothetical protein [Acidobacteriaceae bacterium]
MPNISCQLFNAGTTQNFDGAGVFLASGFFFVLPGTLSGSPGFNAGNFDIWTFPLPVPTSGSPQGCISAVSPLGVAIFNSGQIALPTSPSSYPIGFFVKDLSQTITTSQLALPSFPIVSGNATINSGALTLNAGSVTIAGTFTYQRFVDGIFIASISGTYSYNFTLTPQSLCSNPFAALKVVTLSLGLNTSYGWFGDFLTGLIFDIFSAHITSLVTGLIQQAVNTALMQAFAAQSPPAGTTACVTAITIAPAGITLALTAAVPASSVCPSNVSSG